MKSIVNWLAASCALATAVACSSSSSNNTPTDGGGDSASSGSSDSSTDDTGSDDSSSGTGMEAAPPGCQGASDCMTGQICCVTAYDVASMTPTTACQAAPPCPAVFGMNIQVCKSSAECAGGGTCGAAPMGAMGMICSGGTTPKLDGGTPDSGTPDSGGDAGGDSGGDSASPDAADGG